MKKAKMHGGRQNGEDGMVVGMKRLLCMQKKGIHAAQGGRLHGSSGMQLLQPICPPDGG